MNKLISLFQTKSENILSIYFTAGFPQMTDTVNILECLENAGADIAEVGIPFSDPMADGPVIQKSGQIALQNGMNTEKLFSQLEEAKNKIHIPVLLMGYLNTAYKYGMERFCKRCAEAGVSGLIFPDLPLDIYLDEYATLYDKYDLCFIPLITPQTPDERALKLAEASKGFIYLVSSSVITGGQAVFDEHNLYFRHMRVLLKNKNLLVGFGIHDADTFSKACKHSNGGIIGTAFINAIADSNAEDRELIIKQFVQSKRVASRDIN
jgi:tryptophan synthase alpha chain